MMGSHYLSELAPYDKVMEKFHQDRNKYLEYLRGRSLTLALPKSPAN
jgi:hypothetical protein